MIPYPAQEVDCGLVSLGDRKFGFLLWFGCGGCGSVARNGNTGPPEVICDTADLEINVVHLAKLLCSLLVVAPRLRVEFHPVVAVFPLVIIVRADEVTMRVGEVGTDQHNTTLGNWQRDLTEG